MHKFARTNKRENMTTISIPLFGTSTFDVCEHEQGKSFMCLCSASCRHFFESLVIVLCLMVFVVADHPWPMWQLFYFRFTLVKFVGLKS